VPFGDATALLGVLDDALTRTWDREGILAYARANSWDTRITTLVEELRAVAGGADFRGTR
jgi:hypothetical protein